MADFNFWARVARGTVVFRLWPVKSVPWVLEVPLTKVPPSFAPSLGILSDVGQESRLSLVRPPVALRPSVARTPLRG